MVEDSSRDQGGRPSPTQKSARLQSVHQEADSDMDVDDEDSQAETLMRFPQASPDFQVNIDISSFRHILGLEIIPLLQPKRRKCAPSIKNR